MADLELTEDEQEIFEFLDELRESGETNMFGAASYIQNEFGSDRKESRSFLKKWMDTFSQRHGEKNE